MIFYLAFVCQRHECKRLVGAYASIGAAYRAARAEQFRMIVSNWDLWRGQKQGAPDNDFFWLVERWILSNGQP